MRVFIIDQDQMMAECSELVVQQAFASQGVEILRLQDVVAAMSALAEKVPDLIIMDILLNGPDGFSFLNELASYVDTQNIPVILTSSMDLHGRDLLHYGIVKVLTKETMRPEDLQQAVLEACDYAK